MGGLLLKAKCSFIKKKKTVLWAPAKCFGAQQLSKTQITNANLLPTHSPNLPEKQEILLCLMMPSSLQPCWAEYYVKQVTKVTKEKS